MQKTTGRQFFFFHSWPGHIALIALFVGVVYANSMSGAFVWDDESLIVDNQSIRSIAGSMRFFTMGTWPTEARGAFYRPLQMLTYALDYSLWRLNPYGYHLHNIIIHCLNSIAVYALLVLFLHAHRGALWGSLFFAVHPIHTEAVTYISGRADLLAFLFSSMAVLCFIECIGKRNRIWALFVVIAAYVAALCSKEHALIIPFLIFFLSVAQLPVKITRLMRNTLGLLFLVTVMYCMMRFYAGLPSGYDVYAFTWWERVCIGIKSFALYAALVVFPFHLRMGRHIEPSHTFFDISFLCAAFFFIVFITACCMVGRRSSIGRIAFGWYIIMLLPVLNVFSLNATFAEHWLYYSFPAISLALAVSIERMSSISSRPFFIVIMILILGSMCVGTIMRNEDWRDPVTFYVNTLRYNPRNVRLQYNLGNVYLRRCEPDNALTHYARVIEIAERYPLSTNGPDAPRVLARLLTKTYDNSGNAFQMKKQYAEAIRCYEKALAITPGDELSSINLGTAYAACGEYEKAREQYDNILACNPLHAHARRLKEDLMSRRAGFVAASPEEG